MKKTLFMALAAAVALTACESKPAEQPVEVIAEEKAQEAIGRNESLTIFTSPN